MPDSAVRIRAFDAHDSATFIEIFRSSVRRIALRDYTFAQVIAWAPDEIDVNAWALRCANRQTFVAEIKNVAVGFTDLESDGHLDMLYVHPQHQRQGVASALLARIDSAAREQRLVRLFTESSITARAFFERWGFRVIVPQLVSTRGQEFINYRMEKALA
jgi:putative acetyltransferase